MATAYAHKLKMLEGSSDQGTALFAGSWEIGASGAVGAQTRAKSVTLTRTGVGLYTAQLTNKEDSARCPAIAFALGNLVTNDVDPADADAIRIKTLTVVASTGTVTFACVDEADVVREAASGSSFQLLLVCNMSGVT